MTRMGTVASSPFSVADLEGMPDDGRRYELIDGQLLVSPAPGLRHQVMAAALHRLLDDACPLELFVLIAPFAVRTDVSNEVQPDLLVARRDELTEKNLPAAPILAVEVLSPSGRLVDLNLKRAAYSEWARRVIGSSIPTSRTCWSSNSTRSGHMRQLLGWPVPMPSRLPGRSRCR